MVLLDTGAPGTSGENYISILTVIKDFMNFSAYDFKNKAIKLIFSETKMKVVRPLPFALKLCFEQINQLTRVFPSGGPPMSYMSPLITVVSPLQNLKLAPTPLF